MQGSGIEALIGAAFGESATLLETMGACVARIQDGFFVARNQDGIFHSPTIFLQTGFKYMGEDM